MFPASKKKPPRLGDPNVPPAPESPRSAASAAPAGPRADRASAPRSSPAPRWLFIW